MRTSKIIALILTFVVIAVGIYAGFIQEHQKYDISDLDSGKALGFTVEQSGTEAAEFLSDYVVSTIVIKDSSLPYIVLEFDTPLPAFTKLVLQYGGQSHTRVSGSSKYIIEQLGQPVETITVEIYGASSLKNVFERESISIVNYKKTDAFYYSLVLSLFILLAAWIYGLFHKEPKGFLWNPKKILFHLVYIGCILLFYFLAKYILLDKLNMYGRFNTYRIMFLAFCLYVPYLFFVYRKNITALCVSSILLIGIMHIVFTPASAISWDESVHYKRTIEASSVYNVELSQAENSYRTYSLGVYNDIARRHEAHYRQEQSHLEIGNTYEKTWSLSKVYFELPYYPAGIMTWLGHSLNLSYLTVFMMGKLGNLLLYACLAYWILRKTSNKWLLAAILGLPTIVFTAANYSYDAWTLGFSALSLVYYIEALKTDKAFTAKDIFIICGSIFLTATAKAAYLGLALILFFTPKAKFANLKQKILWYVSLLTILILTVFAFMGSAYTASDYDGMLHDGMDINLRRQLAFIIQNPLHYLKIFFVYITSRFTDFKYSNDFTVLYGIQRPPIFNYIGQLVLIVLAFIDKDKGDSHVGLSKRILLLLSSLVSLFILCTAIYLDFTPVGHHTILGVQTRYWIPLLFPILYGVSSPKIVNNYNKTLLNIIAVGVNTMLSLISILTILVIILY